MFNLVISCENAEKNYTFTSPQGTVNVTDLGESPGVTPPSGYSWYAKLTFGTDAYLYSYNGTGGVGVITNAQGDVSFQVEGDIRPWPSGS
jgi:hypothetical protein